MKQAPSSRMVSVLRMRGKQWSVARWRSDAASKMNLSKLPW
jgi:hypothetical protein